MSMGRPKGAYLEDRQLKPHGTNAARDRHKYRGEPLCDLCAVKAPNHFGAKPKGQGWKQNKSKGTAEGRAGSFVRAAVIRACAGCGQRGQVNSKLKIGKEGFLCPDCR